MGASPSQLGTSLPASAILGGVPGSDRPTADERSHDTWEHVQRGLVYPAPHANTTAVVGVGFRQWARWCAQDCADLPEGMRLLFPASPDDPTTSAVFARSAGTFTDPGGDLWFHLESDDERHCRSRPAHSPSRRR